MNALLKFRETWSSYLDENEDDSLNTLKQVKGDEPLPTGSEDLENQIKENKEGRLGQFQDKIEEKYSSFYDEDTEEKDLSKFEKAQEKLGEIKEKIMNGDIDKAIQILDKDLPSFEEDFDYMEKMKASNSKDTTEKKIKKVKESENKNNKNVMSHDDKGQSTTDASLKRDRIPKNDPPKDNPPPNDPPKKDPKEDEEPSKNNPPKDDKGNQNKRDEIIEKLKQKDDEAKEKLDKYKDDYFSQK